MPQSWDMGQILSLPLRRKACWGFLMYRKNPTASAGFELRIVVIVVLCSWSGRPAGPTTNTARLSPRYEGKNQKLLLQSLSSWWWAGKRPKHVQLYINVRTINWKTAASGWWFIWTVRWCTDLQTLNYTVTNIKRSKSLEIFLSGLVSCSGSRHVQIPDSALATWHTAETCGVSTMQHLKLICLPFDRCLS
jgi:hypothetical protein